MLKLYNKNNPHDRIEKVVKVLQDGGVIIFPTGTTYALGCHALKERAVERICKIRNIDPSGHPLSVICYDMSTISEFAHITTPIYKIMKHNLPGPFTFILPGKNKLPKIFRNKKNGEIGIRMPESNILKEILEALEAPIMTSSLPAPLHHDEDEASYFLNPELINETFGNIVDLVIDGGIGTTGKSTVVRFHDDEIEILREGDGTLI